MTAGAARDPGGEGIAAWAVRDRQGQAFRDARYASRERIWSGEPNRQLVAEAASLPPARALDAGSGEGADALSLAERGWRVWDIVVAEARPRRGAHQDGRAVTLHDAVVRARRRG